MSGLKKNRQNFRPQSWSNKYVDINAKGEVIVKIDEGAVPLCKIYKQLQDFGFQLPAVIRFPELIVSQADSITKAFSVAIKKYKYNNLFTGIYPLKVNPMSAVTKTFLSSTNFGFEAGSKTELLEALSLALPKNRTVLVNGHKDDSMLQSVLEATKCGFRVVSIIEKINECDRVVAMAKKLKVTPRLGVRVRLHSRGSGRWRSSTGERSKFGLNTLDLLKLVERLERENLLKSFELLHFHIGSQITDVRKISKSLREAARIYCRLKQKGVPLKTLDVGGGLGVDYDGSQTYSDSSVNYSINEYANNVVYIVGEVCEEEGVEVPELISESGRFLVAHHAMLLVKSLGRNSVNDVSLPPKQKKEHDLISSLRYCYKNISKRNVQESIHDARDYKEDGLHLFDLGYLSLEERSAIESLTWAVLKKSVNFLKDKEKEKIKQEISDQIIMNFSIFQSLPDYWAMEHNFPIMPIDNLNVLCDQEATISDVTCDSDGKINSFISGDDEKKSTLKIHPSGVSEDVMGIFLIGAYQDILGDLHNLFGPLNEVEVVWKKGKKNFDVRKLDKGSNVSQTLELMHLDSKKIVEKLLTTLTAKCEDKSHIIRVKKHFKSCLTDSTYFNSQS